jgi:hypothetical protein
VSLLVPMVLAVDELVAVLVDGVVGDVNERVGQLGQVGGVGFSGKSDQTILVNINLERINSSEKDIDPEVKLVTIDKVGTAEIPLDTGDTLPLWNILHPVDNLDTLPTAQVRWLHYP